MTGGRLIYAEDANGSIGRIAKDPPDWVEIDAGTWLWAASLGRKRK